MRTIATKTLGTLTGRSRVSYLSGGVAAAMASVLLVVLFAFYLAPFGVIVCGGIPVNPPEIRAGEAHFDRPVAIIVTVKRDRAVYVGPNVVPADGLRAELERVRATFPGCPLELRADRKITMAQLTPVLRAMRDAGYSQFSVFGRPSSVLELAAQVPGT
jgi:biopolymer transport protein ExbD